MRPKGTLGDHGRELLEVRGTDVQCLVHLWSSLSLGGCLAGALGAGKAGQIPFSGMLSPSPGTGGEGEQSRQSSYTVLCEPCVSWEPLPEQTQQCLQHSCLREAAAAGWDCLVFSVPPGILVQLELWHFAL